jgi:hypothetical protein
MVTNADKMTNKLGNNIVNAFLAEELFRFFPAYLVAYQNRYKHSKPAHHMLTSIYTSVLLATESPDTIFWWIVPAKAKLKPTNPQTNSHLNLYNLLAIHSLV